MKTPQRPFVVEYKANRRQTQTRPSSIWGSLDLQAVARQVAADGILPDTGHSVAGPTIDDPKPAETSVPSPDLLAAPEHRPQGPAAGILPDGIGAAKREHSSEAAATETSVAPTPRHRRAAHVSRRTVVASVQAEPASIPAMTPVNGRQARLQPDNHIDDLSALDAENRHLKRLLIAKLREENRALQTMLRRFASNDECALGKAASAPFE
ncbi:hypothetical protein [Rhizobium ruizarguesonis]|uniref:Uncharacterized protein n=1 Tax=Rhizobium ruizarguesonis TaxID=2081791 RepID=A0AAE8TYY1_9HYPH|nr:hypothetical protein [Rhizobium ruizarguesonis]NEH89155.1 hypothetical protein [Rhizobium ruizarguesonis]NEJ18245.1 hypothetical protein [Rhizobium ruizarguesonis]NEK32236.1 hypothetical protein [Rhizobium ruizarguesonis]TAW85779.1 hypothetical protein ELI12_30385 [Rhizobium ruizarguesonis]TBF03514.1 hypothetical protein ELG94_34790 [Rhizobium ruizarguesonis]